MAGPLEFHILIVGAGGTGSIVLSNLARYLDGYLAKEGHHEVRLMVMDGDRVELKNLERQIFIDEDIGSNKAVALCGALSEVFTRVCPTAYPEYLHDVTRLKEIFSAAAEKIESYQRRKTGVVKILVGCVDNHRARQVMHQYFKKEKDLFYIDAANEFAKGEVVCGIRAKGKTLSQDRAFYFPDVMRSREKRAGESCGTINASAPQHILTNMLAANIVLRNVIQILTFSKDIRGGITYFDAFTSEMVTVTGDADEQKRTS